MFGTYPQLAGGLWQTSRWSTTISVMDNSLEDIAVEQGGYFATADAHG